VRRRTRRTARRTPVDRSSLPAATRAESVPMKPCPARWDVPSGSRVVPPACSWQVSTSGQGVPAICAHLRTGKDGDGRSKDESGSDVGPGHELILRVSYMPHL